MFSNSTFRSNCPEVFCIKVVPKISAIFTGKHLRWSLFLIKLQGLQHRCFPVNIVEFLRITFFVEHFWWLIGNFFTGSQKETVFSINCSVRKTFECSFPVDFAFNMPMRCSERTPKPETIFYSVDFLAVIIYHYFLFLYMQKRSFYLSESPSVLTPFHYFTPLQHKFWF